MWIEQQHILKLLKNACRFYYLKMPNRRILLQLSCIFEVHFSLLLQFTALNFRRNPIMQILPIKTFQILIDELWWFWVEYFNFCGNLVIELTSLTNSRKSHNSFSAGECMKYTQYTPKIDFFRVKWCALGNITLCFSSDPFF